MPKGSLNAKPKPIFNGTVMASAGSSELGEKWNDANLSKWLRNYGGRFAPDFDDSVTHLIASKDQFKQMNNRVKEALKRKKVQIVLVDWLEMSMAANKLLPIKNYSLTTIRKEANAKKRRSEQKERDIRNGVNYVNTNLYGLYKDDTGFFHQVTLERAEGERMILELFESRATPPLYIFGIRYFKQANAKSRPYRQSDHPGSYDREFNGFRHAFHKKTGVSWDDRLKRADVNGIVTSLRSKDSDLYRYKIPTGGKPLGLVKGRPYEPTMLRQRNETKVAAGTPNIGGIANVDTFEVDGAETENLIMTTVRDFAYKDDASNGNIPKRRPEPLANVGETSIFTPPATSCEPINVARPQEKLSLAPNTASASNTHMTSPRTPRKPISRKEPGAPGKHNAVEVNRRNRLTFKGSPTGATQQDLAIRDRLAGEQKLMNIKSTPKTTYSNDVSKSKGKGKALNIAPNYQAVNDDSCVELRPALKSDANEYGPESVMEDESKKLPTNDLSVSDLKQCKSYIAHENPQLSIIGEIAADTAVDLTIIHQDDNAHNEPGGRRIDKSGATEDMIETERGEAADEQVVTISSDEDEDSDDIY